MKNARVVPIKDKIILLITGHKTAVLAGVFLIFGFLLGRMSISKSLPATEVHPGSAVNPDTPGHGEEEHSLTALEKAVCEHQLPVVDCDTCRYEVGVVKIDPTIAESLIEKGLAEAIDRTLTLKLTGQVHLDGIKTVDVVSTGSGRIDQVQKLLGDKVQKGEILAVIHSGDLGQAKADFLEAHAKLELAQTTFKREKDLYEQKITSEAEYLSAMNELKTAEAAYAAADKRLQLLGLDASQIAGIKDKKENGDFANLVLHAPQEGTIIAQMISVGKMIGTTESLYTIADLSNVWVWCDVYETDLAVLHEQFEKGRPLEAKVRVKAFEPAVFHGTVDFVGPVMDEHTRTVKMRVQVKNPENKLRPGMFADVEAAIPLPQRMTAVPQAAVMSDAGQTFVFQHWKNDLWIRRDVAVGKKYGDFIEILSGIPKGATIVTSGAFMLKSDILREKMGAGCAD